MNIKSPVKGQGLVISIPDRNNLRTKVMTATLPTAALSLEFLGVAGCQTLQESDIPVDLRKAKQLVQADAQSVFDFRIARELGISPRNRPLFNRSHEGSADALLAKG